MSKWIGNIISKNARYRTQSTAQDRGIYSLDEQLQHRDANNWMTAAKPASEALFEDAGYHVPILSIMETTSASDNTDHFSAVSIDMGATAETGRIYIAVKVTANTTYYNDFCIGAVQISTDDGGMLDSDNEFMMHDDGTTWQRGSTDTAANNTLSSVSGYTWTNIANGGVSRRFNRATSTSSSRTGARGGLTVGTGYNIQDELSLSEGNNDAVLAQTDSNYYIYTETSGAPHGNVMWCRSPEFTIDNFEAGSTMVIAYHAWTSSGGTGMINTVAEPLLTVFWDEA